VVRHHAPHTAISEDGEVTQPNVTVTVTRTWNWGIVVLRDDKQPPPDIDSRRRVTANGSGLVVLVRHAQDIATPDDASSDDVLPSAEASVSVTFWEEASDVVRPGDVQYEGNISTPSGRLSIGDADHEVWVASPTTAMTVRVTAADLEFGTEHAWIDFYQP
jgi:hypothetical protein